MNIMFIQQMTENSEKTTLLTASAYKCLTEEEANLFT